MSESEEYWTWVRFKLFAEGDAAGINPSDFLHPNPMIRGLCYKLKPLSDEERFLRLGKMLRGVDQ